MPAFLGRTFREIAAAQETLRQRTGRYASSRVELASVALPPETRMVYADGSDWEYRVQIDSGLVRRLSCVITGGRTAQARVRPFTVNCVRQAAGAR